MKISIATKFELPIIKDLALKIWPSAYGEIISDVQLEYMLTKFYDLDFLEIQMNVKNQVFLIIENENKPVGFCSYELNIENSENTKLHKLYVLPETQGTGIGKKLLNEVEKIALENKNFSVILNVNRYNTAFDFYKKQNYNVVKEVDIEIGNGYLMEDFVMEKKLKKF